MGTFKFVPNAKGIAELLRSPQIAADLHARAERIAAAASDGDAEYNVHSEIGTRRARAAVVTANIEAQLAEHRERRLARAIDAARG